MATPYAEYVGDRDPVDVLRESRDAFRRLAASMPASRWREPLAPGKWTLHQILVHIAQWELIFSVRVRCGVAVPGFVVQPLDQDPFIYEAAALDTPTAIAAFEGLRGMNLALAAALTPEQRRRRLRHPERGEIDVEDLLTTLAGHAVHHLRQLERALAAA